MKRTELKRKTPLRSGWPKPKVRPTVGCAWSGRCPTSHLPIRVGDGTERYCRSHGTKAADWLYGLTVKVRDRRCRSCGTTVDLEWAHVLSRGARYIRYHPENSMALCRADHFRFTRQPSAWSVFVERLSPGLWSRMSRLEADAEEAGGAVDYAAVIAEARERLQDTDLTLLEMYAASSQMPKIYELIWPDGIPGVTALHATLSADGEGEGT